MDSRANILLQKIRQADSRNGDSNLRTWSPSGQFYCFFLLICNFFDVHLEPCYRAGSSLFLLLAAVSYVGFFCNYELRFLHPGSVTEPQRTLGKSGADDRRIVGPRDPIHLASLLTRHQWLDLCRRQNLDELREHGRFKEFGQINLLDPQHVFYVMDGHRHREMERWHRLTDCDIKLQDLWVDVITFRAGKCRADPNRPKPNELSPFWPLQASSWWAWQQGRATFRLNWTTQCHSLMRSLAAAPYSRTAQGRSGSP